MATALIGLVSFSLMVLLALRANTRFSNHDTLPMQFGLDGQPTWCAARAFALGFMPALCLAVFLPFALFLPDTLGALVAGAALISGQIFYHWLIRRAQ